MRSLFVLPLFFFVFQAQGQDLSPSCSHRGIHVGKRTEVEAYRLTNRAGSGVISMKLSPKTGKTVIGNVIVDKEQD